MTSEAAVAEVIQVLEATNTPYMVVGAFSSNAYGIGRATKDADFVIKADSPRVIEIARKLGPDFHLQRQMQLETITGSVRSIIKYSPTDFDIELFRLTDDDHHQSRFARRVRRLIPGINCDAWIPTAEDVIIQKTSLETPQGSGRRRERPKRQWGISRQRVPGPLDGDPRDE